MTFITSSLALGARRLGYTTSKLRPTDISCKILRHQRVLASNSVLVQIEYTADMPTMRPPFSTLFLSFCLPNSRISCRPFSPSQVLRTRPSIIKRPLSTTLRHRLPPSSPPSTTSRGPPSDETTQTDFNTMDVLGNTPPPTTAIDACLSDGFHLNNGVKIGGGSGCLLVGGEAFGWRPWEAMVQGREGKTGMVNTKGQWDVGDGAWGVLEVVWPKPGNIFSSPSPFNQFFSMSYLALSFWLGEKLG